MKYLSAIFSLSFFLLLSVQVQAQHNHSNHGNQPMETKKGAATGTTDIFMVYGNCTLCEKRIESSLAHVEGVNSADWEVDTKVMTVIYDNEVISLDEIKKKVADAGHDTDKFQANEKAYNNLPGCCQYDRPEKKAEKGGDGSHKH